MSDKRVLVELFRKFGANNLLSIFDIDLTLRDTMCRMTSEDEHFLMGELFNRTEGGVILMSGRSSTGIDETIRGKLPLSSEHHSAMRFEQHGDVISLAPTIDTQAIADQAAMLLSGQITLVDSPRELRNANGHFSAVFPEVKEFAVALVHSLGHDRLEGDREILQDVASQVLISMGYEATHKIAVGSDAIEIVPKGLSADSKARSLLSPKEVERLEIDGLHKGSGIHNFMSYSLYQGRTPFVIGDSGTDGKAMNVCLREYGGGGVWVNNGKPVPADFQEAVNGYQIETFLDSWDQIKAAVVYLRETAPTVKIMPGLPTSDSIAIRRPS